jgi:hypothetical protein
MFSLPSVPKQTAKNLKASAELLPVTAIQMGAAVVGKNGCYVVMEVWSALCQTVHCVKFGVYCVKLCIVSNLECIVSNCALCQI